MWSIVFWLRHLKSLVYQSWHFSRWELKLILIILDHYQNYCHLINQLFTANSQCQNSMKVFSARDWKASLSYRKLDCEIRIFRWLVKSIYMIYVAYLCTCVNGMEPPIPCSRMYFAWGIINKANSSSLLKAKLFYI